MSNLVGLYISQSFLLVGIRKHRSHTIWRPILFCILNSTNYRDSIHVAVESVTDSNQHIIPSSIRDSADHTSSRRQQLDQVIDLD